MNMSSHIAIQTPFLSKKNIGERILWARTHEYWTLQQWSNVLFTDESSFTVRPTKNRSRVWKKPGQRLHQRCIIPTFKSVYQVVSVWGGFSMNGRTPLAGTIVIFDSNSYRVMNESLSQHLSTRIKTEQLRLCFTKIIMDPQSPFYRYVSTKRKSHAYEVAGTESGFEFNRRRMGDNEAEFM